VTKQQKIFLWEGTEGKVITPPILLFELQDYRTLEIIPKIRI
jgi:hypothetical protein